MIATIRNVFAKLDGFLLAIFGAVILAYFWPKWGLQTQPFALEDMANHGVSITFFFYGLKLSAEKLKNGLANWKMHILIQTTTFLAFPLLALASKPFFHTPHYEQLWLGIFFLSALPSTVSSSVVMTSIAGGNIPAAIFNASLASLIGLFLTPIWVGIFMLSDTNTFDPSHIALKLTYQVLLPVTIGILLNKIWGNWAERNKKHLTRFDQSVILVIIYTSFSKSFTMNVFTEYSSWEIASLGILLLILFFAVLYFTSKISFFLNFSKEDTITSMFCGSKKSLVHGTVMSKVLFAGHPNTGILLLPIMLYHAIQLLTTSYIARRIAKKDQFIFPLFTK